MKDKIKNILDVTFWKFVLVGIVNTLVGTAVMFAAYNVLHLSYWISSASNYVVGSIVSYFLNKYFTFQNKEKSWKQLVKFALNITVCYLVAYGLAKPLVSWFLHGQSKRFSGSPAITLIVPVVIYMTASITVIILFIFPPQIIKLYYIFYYIMILIFLLSLFAFPDIFLFSKHNHSLSHIIKHHERSHSN